MLDSAVYIIFKCYKVAVFHRILLGNLISELPVVNVQIITVVHTGNVLVFVIVSIFVRFCSSPEVKLYLLVCLANKEHL